MTNEAPDTFFPELEGDEREIADAWLRDYLRLVIQIHRGHLASTQPPELSTAQLLTGPEVLALSIRPPEEPSSLPT